MPTLSDIAAYLVGTGFIGATTAYGVVRWLGTKWFDTKLAERLETGRAQPKFISGMGLQRPSLSNCGAARGSGQEF
jgi:hypothetical protein